MGKSLTTGSGRTNYLVHGHIKYLIKRMPIPWSTGLSSLWPRLAQFPGPWTSQVCDQGQVKSLTECVPIPWSMDESSL